MTIRVMNDHDKPSLEDTLEHYGVKGMKWGVRRDQAALDRAAGRSLVKGMSRGQQIRKARDSVSDSKYDLKKAAEKKSKTKHKYVKASPEQKAAAKKQMQAAEKQFSEAQKNFENNPARALSARMTYGEMAVTALFLTPVTTAVIVGATEGVGAKRRAELRKKKP